MVVVRTVNVADEDMRQSGYNLFFITQQPGQTISHEVYSLTSACAGSSAAWGQSVRTDIIKPVCPRSAMDNRQQRIHLILLELSHAKRQWIQVESLSIEGHEGESNVRAVTAYAGLESAVE